jgi:hypothetical protein
LVQGDEVTLLECCRLLRTGQKIERLDLVPFEQGFQARVPNVPNSINIDEGASQVVFMLILDNKRISTKHSVSVLDRSEPVVYVSHVPMQVFHPSMGANMLEECVEHFTFKLVVPFLDLVKRYIFALGHLMNREGDGLTGVQLPYGD